MTGNPEMAKFRLPIRSPMRYHPCPPKIKELDAAIIELMAFMTDYRDFSPTAIRNDSLEVVRWFTEIHDFRYEINFWTKTVIVKRPMPHQNKQWGGQEDFIEFAIVKYTLAAHGVGIEIGTK